MVEIRSSHGSWCLPREVCSSWRRNCWCDVRWNGRCYLIIKYFTNQASTSEIVLVVIDSMFGLYCRRIILCIIVCSVLMISAWLYCVGGSVRGSFQSSIKSTINELNFIRNKSRYLSVVLWLLVHVVNFTTLCVWFFLKISCLQRNRSHFFLRLVRVNMFH